MALGNLPACLAVTLPHEGGWSDHPKDPGGATMKGITLAVFRKWVPGATKADLRAISDAAVEKIYRVDYWNPLRGEDLPAGVDLAVFDFGVNSGPSRSAKYLQGIVGTKQDGVIGTATLSAVNTQEPSKLVKSICAKRLGFVKGLSTWATFGKGWSRRIADVEAKGVAMVLKASGMSSTAMTQELRKDAAEALNTSKTQDKTAVVTSGGAGGAGLAEVALGDVNWLLIGGALVLGLAIFAMIKSRAAINSERAFAYTREAMTAEAEPIA